MFTHDPRSAKASKGFESPTLQGRVNSLGSSIFAGISPWINVDPFCLGLSFLRIYLIWRYRLGRELGLQELVVLEQDELPSCIGLEFRARLDGGQMYSGQIEAKRLP
ncbi:hypothetical protein Tco_0726762 [Tanacetum coccineum]|uniref:Uncharacterized protein n=1 Tax=Tanacetum coccineum TaxID=301880 RepID=A0ABQ4YHG0_9ASTR